MTVNNDEADIGNVQNQQSGGGGSILQRILSALLGKSEKELSSIIYVTPLFGISYQIIFLILIGKVSFFSRTQVISDSIVVIVPIIIWILAFECFTRLTINITNAYMYFRAEEDRQVIEVVIIASLLSYGILGSIVAYDIISQASTYFLFLILVIVFSMVMAQIRLLVRWLLLKHKDAQSLKRVSDNRSHIFLCSMILTFLGVICVYINSDPFRYHRLHIYDNVNLTGIYEIEYMNDRYVMVTPNKEKRSDTAITYTLPSDSLNYSIDTQSPPTIVETLDYTLIRPLRELGAKLILSLSVVKNLCIEGYTYSKNSFDQWTENKSSNYTGNITEAIIDSLQKKNLE